MMKPTYQRQASSSPTSATVAEEFSSSHNEEDCINSSTGAWYDGAASLPAAPPTLPLSGSESWTTTSGAINAAIHVVGIDGHGQDEDEDGDDEYYDDGHSACSNETTTTTNTTTVEETFHLYSRPENITDRKCEKIVKYAHRRLNKLETSSSSYHNFYHLLKCQAPTLRHKQIEIGNVIGKGAFSSVYSVVSIDNQNIDDEEETSSPTLSSDKVVIKFLRSKLYSNPAMLAACAGDLCKEAIMLSHLNHSNILKVVATSPNGVDSYINGCHDAFFMVLEKLDHTLSDRLNVWTDNRRMLGGKTAVNRRLRSILQLREDETNGAESSSNSFTVASSSDASRQKKKNKNKTLKSPLRAAGLGRLFSRAGRKSSSSSSSSHSSSHWTILPNIINLEERLDAALQLADAVSFIHSKGILHRDLKPDNIGFDSDGVLKVFDFDVSRRVPACMRDEYNRQSIMESPMNGGDDSASTSTSSRKGGRNKEMTILMTRRVGSPRYMCPESARGEETNLKGDVYTYSLLLHELLTLEKPYDDIANEDHDEFVFYRHVRPRIPSKLPSELKRLIQRGWSEKVRHRPTMSTMTYDLEEQLPRLLPPTRTVVSSSSPSSVSTPKKKMLQSNITNNDDCFASPMSTSVCTAPLTADNSDRQHRRSISKSLKANLLRRSDCVPSLLATN